ncbi:MAG: hypothetical protein R3C25_05045 [Hyphomonadaceae bacterium]
MHVDLTLAVAVAFLVSMAVCRVVMALGPRDGPTEDRKRHQAPTPTSGGIGIGAGFGAAILTLLIFSLVWRNQISNQGLTMLWVSVLFAYPLLFVGVFDDARGLSAQFKFVVYAVLSLAAAWMMGVVREIHVGEWVLVLPFAVGLLGTALWVFTAINVVNFMDGANGLSMGAVALGLLALAALAAEGGSASALALALSGAGALAGFLVWNFPKGRLFAGDSGALFAGAIAAFSSLIVIARTGVSPLVAAIVFFPLLADALLTLTHRIASGRSLMVGHTEHLYQLLIACGWSHARTR